MDESPFESRGAGRVGAPGVDRRTFLGAAAAAWQVAWVGQASGARGDDPAGGLIVRSTRPLDLETPPSALGERLTPNDLFFVRSHFGSPAVTPGPWPLAVDGLVDRPQGWTLDDLSGFERVTVPAVLQCAGNGRAFFRPRIPGLAWERGAVGHAEWTGVRLADVLKKAGIRPGAAHVHLRGADGPPSPKTPAFFRSIPLERALDPSTILATAMNGEPLPVLHGGPVRLVVPGWTGNHWLKWIRSVTAAEKEFPGFYMQTGYRMPRVPVPPDVTPPPGDLVPVTVMNVKSLITGPAEGSAVRGGRVEVRGVAWTGEGHVDRVDVQTGSGAWRPAELLDPPVAGSWRRWRLAVDLPADAGAVALRSRATDSRGQVQPEATAWNKSGYLWNGIDVVTVRVGGQAG